MTGTGTVCEAPGAALRGARAIGWAGSGWWMHRGLGLQVMGKFSGWWSTQFYKQLPCVTLWDERMYFLLVQKEQDQV